MPWEGGGGEKSYRWLWHKEMADEKKGGVVVKKDENGRIWKEILHKC